MKTYEEMAESVLRIGKEKRTAELRKRKILLTGGSEDSWRSAAGRKM